MKSKRDFTLEEVYKIKELIRLKLQASSEEQKRLEPRYEILVSIGKTFIQEQKYRKWSIMLRILKIGKKRFYYYSRIVLVQYKMAL